MLKQHVRSGEVLVPEGHLFVLGDNRDNSLDSRYFGLVPRTDVVGHPLFIYGSFAARDERQAPSRLPDLRRVRWSRMCRWL